MNYKDFVIIVILIFNFKGFFDFLRILKFVHYLFKIRPELLILDLEYLRLLDLVYEVLKLFLVIN